MRHHPFVLVVAALAASAPAQEPALRGLDPVLLTQGEQTPGREDLTERAGQFLYRFAREQTRDAFRADVARYEIQFGGACARMGPLSGSGDKDRFALHDGRIYVFASDECRDGFLKQPPRFFDPEVPRPAADAVADARGAALLARAIAAHGGAEALRAIRTYRHLRSEKQGEYTVEHRVRIAFPAAIRIDDDWIGADKTYRYARVVTADDAFFVDGGAARDMHATGRREMLRALLHEPLFALRRALDGDRVARAAGKGTIGGVEVEVLELWQDGTSTAFGLDATGKIRSARFHGRGPQLLFGQVERAFEDRAVLNGVTVPGVARSWFDGKEVPAHEVVRFEVAVDDELSADLHKRPG